MPLTATSHAFITVTHGLDHRRGSIVHFSQRLVAYGYFRKVEGCRDLVNPCDPAADSELQEKNWRNPWHPAMDSGDDEMNLNGSVAGCHEFRFVEDSVCHAYKYQVVVPGEDVWRAKMAEAEDRERDMRRRSKASRLGMSGLGNY
ncbi:hypothetical protein PIB30_006977 [Stylosanthes scabra]|uniref:Uncharacterized protein n=1 Tax=Stylosanthes scabra TaxID=79078 RepID=A0ABU6Z519_9FABA|nr:hypothetical protein [Stylosanthes scabra]